MLLWMLSVCSTCITVCVCVCVGREGGPEVRGPLLTPACDSDSNTW